MMNEHIREQLWYAIKECVEGGVSPQEFKQEAALSWELALRDRLKWEVEEMNK